MRSHIPLSTELRMIAARYRSVSRGVGSRGRGQALRARPFFVVTSERTGSNLLVDYLRSLPGVAMTGEALSPLLTIGIRTRLVSRRAVLRHLRKTLRDLDGDVVGAKLMFWHLHEIHRLSLDDLREAFPDVRFIILYRSSLAEQYVSHRIAEATGQFALRDGAERREARVVVDPDDFRLYCSRIREHYERALAVPWMKERGVILSYDELIEEPQSMIRDRLAPLLSVEYAAPRSALVRQNPAPLQERVINYCEVEGLFASSEARQTYAFGRTGQR